MSVFPVGLVAGGLAAWFASAAAMAAPAPDTRAEMIARRVETWRADRGIVEMAVALVADGEVVFARGFGSDDDARFPIGSIGNGLRAAVIATLVDERAISWDAPIQASLPDFTLRLRTEDTRAAVTWRDVFLHRTGFSGMDLLLASPSTPRDHTLRLNIARAEPWDTFRARAVPNDALMLAIEEAASRVAGSSWEVLLHDRILARERS